MKLEVTLTKDTTQLAREVVDNPVKGDIEKAVGRVFDAARKKYQNPLWECDISVRVV